MPSERTSSTKWLLPIAVGAGLLIAAWAWLLIAAASDSSDDGSPLVTDRARYNASPANAGSLALTLPEASGEPWCLLSGGALVVWPRGSTYDVAAGEVRDRSGDLLGRVGDTIEGGGMVGESPSSSTLDDVDWAGCTPADEVLHQYG
jgi:hypothetical protein